MTSLNQGLSLKNITGFKLDQNNLNLKSKLQETFASKEKTGNGTTSDSISKKVNLNFQKLITQTPEKFGEMTTHQKIPLVLPTIDFNK